MNSINRIQEAAKFHHGRPSTPPEKNECLRRLRVGNIRSLLRYRYGPTLPDDDAGREDLRELLLAISIAPANANSKMKNAIEVHAPWMSETEAASLIEDINRTPEFQRWRTASDLGQRMQLTNHDRERLRLWTIQPVDMSAEQMAEHRRYKKMMRERNRRRKRGRQPREEYLAGSLSRQEPWKAEGISRRTWQRRRAKEA